MYTCMGETTHIRRDLALLGFCAAWLCAASAVYAQAQRTPAGVPHPPAASTAIKPELKPPAAEPEQPASAPTEQAPSPFPTDAAARPATVNLKNGKLTIEANNSDLGQILQNVASISGMTINGLNTGPRVFGVYGPGDSRDVLKDLLVGSGFNFIMVGDGAQGTPRELVLTPQNKNAPASVPASPPPPAPDDVDEPDQPQVEVIPTPAEPLGPGAIVPAPSPNSQEDDNVRVQQTLQRLQHMQEQEQPKPPH